MKTTSKNSDPDKVEQWWGETDFRQMEQITGFRQLDFEPDEGYQEFVDVCNNYWGKLGREEKIELWQTYN